MTPSATQHLNWDDLDDLLMGTERESVHVHLETCPECRKLAAADLDVVVRLQRLPQLAPRAGFADRVLRDLAVPDRLTVRPAERQPWLKAASVIIAFAGFGGSLGWSLANQSWLLSIRAEALAGVQAWGQGALAVLASLPRSPVVTALGDTLGGVGMGLILTALAGGYLAALLAVRRLVALPGARP